MYVFVREMVNWYECTENLFDTSNSGVDYLKNTKF